jgi:hypothetical protein
MFTPVVTKISPVATRSVSVVKGKAITKDLTEAIYKRIRKNAKLDANVRRMKKFVLEFKQDTLFQRFVDPTHMQSYQALLTTHPWGTTLTDNRLSGNFFDLIKSCGTYFGLAPVQTRKNSVHLKSKVGPFGIDSELTHYTTKPDPKTQESSLERGIRVHGDRRMDNGRVNPVLGAGGKYVVQYRLTRPIRLLNLDFNDPEFCAIIDWLGKDETIAPLLPQGVSLSDLFLSEEARDNRLLHQAISAALYAERHLLNIDGLVMKSTRGDASIGTEDSSIICTWSADNAVLDWLVPYSISFFDYSSPLPRLFRTFVDKSTNYKKLRDDARTANKE